MDTEKTKTPEADMGINGKERKDTKMAITSSRTVPGSAEYPLWSRIATACFYAMCAMLIVVVNKLVLTSYKFPSFLSLGLGQMVVTVVVLQLSKMLGLVHFPSPHKDTFKQVWPLPLLFFGNIVFSLGGTQRLSMPMYVVLRRFSNFLIMIGEYYVLGVVATPFIQFTVYLMILGAIIAASGDLAFDLIGYTFILATNLCSSASGVFTKQKLNAKTLGKYGLMFYNSLFMMGPLFLLSYVTGDIHKSIEYEHWNDPLFLAQFVMACVAGFMINYATMLCTQYNSALTTSIVGVLKNLVIVYAGMFIGGDYIYSTVNFIGINVSVVGGLMYSYATFTSKVPKTPVISNQSNV
ncbi:solute carrier family 35 member D2-like protein isoform X2 [Littorina saxatilis]|uniref:solute carrier family 35 member D2-like protein isoform X2 n=1 Tax=Littorina saxatilis TaxID=31220 RepID=UPI0038B490F7